MAEGVEGDMSWYGKICSHCMKLWSWSSPGQSTTSWSRWVQCAHHCWLAECVVIVCIVTSSGPVEMVKEEMEKQPPLSDWAYALNS